jgi:ribosomal protein S18 acetylase RimI-like enzyme
VPSILSVACTIRRKQPNDDTFISNLGEEAFAEYSPTAGSQTLSMSNRKGAVTLIAERNGSPVGLAILQLGEPLDRPGVAYLHAIAVTAPERGRGIGRKLLAKAVGLVRARGVREIQLSTADANLAALDLFTKSGFSITKRLEGHYRRGQAAYLMSKVL